MNVPKLRFKDDDGREFSAWKEKKLKDVFTVKYGKDYKHLEEGNIPLLGTGGVMKYVNQYIYDKPSVLIGRKGTIDKPQFIETPFWTVDTLFYTKINEGYSPYFVYLLVLQVDWYKYNEATGVPSLNTTAINNIDVTVPTDIEEQTKIANFLTAIDEKITQLTQKHDLLKQYKKGVMQQIFSQKLRFKDDDGREFPEWEEKKLGSVATFYNGRAYKQNEWENTGIPVIRLQNLTGSSISYYYSNIRLPENQYCNKGDLLFMWSATFGPVWWNGGKAIYHYHIWKIETNLQQLSKNYLFYVLENITAKMKNTSNGSTMLHITKEGIEKLRINVPDVKEQTKIANFLTAIDDKITHTQTQLDAVKLYKKGLLQQLFV